MYELMATVDVDKSGFVDFAEFAARFKVSECSTERISIGPSHLPLQVEFESVRQADTSKPPVSPKKPKQVHKPAAGTVEDAPVSTPRAFERTRSFWQRQAPRRTQGEQRHVPQHSGSVGC